MEDASTSSTASTTSPFKAAGVAALDAQARKDNEMRIDAIKAQNQLRGINSLDRYVTRGMRGRGLPRDVSTCAPHAHFLMMHTERWTTWRESLML